MSAATPSAAAPARALLDLPPGTRVMLYDGVCGLCDRAVQFTLPRDKNARLRYAALQTELGREILERHGLDPDALDTFYLVTDPGGPAERVHGRARGAVEVGRTLGGVWAALASLAALLPWALLDRAYDFVAQRRYRWFGKHDACPIPAPEWRARFLA